jgi:hypothetical protein
MTHPPVVLLDVDGVVNATSKQLPTRHWPLEQWTKTKIKARDGVEYPFAWAAPVVQWLTGLHTSGRAEIRWHTTWQHEALVVGRTLGLPEFAVQECPEWQQYCDNGSALRADLIRACMPGWWKYPAAERVVAEEKRRLIWIDDDIDLEISRRTRNALKSVHQLELVCPAQGTGIITKHIAQVENTLARWEEARGAVSGS